MSVTLLSSTCFTTQMRLILQNWTSKNCFTKNNLAWKSIKCACQIEIFGMCLSAPLPCYCGLWRSANESLGWSVYSRWPEPWSMTIHDHQYFWNISSLRYYKLPSNNNKMLLKMQILYILLSITTINGNNKDCISNSKDLDLLQF